MCRAIELETIDLGLQPAEECSNNRSMRGTMECMHAWFLYDSRPSILPLLLLL